MSFQIQITHEKIKGELEKLKYVSPQLENKILSQIGVIVVGEAQRNLRGGDPLNVITARLWNSVTSRVQGKTVFVGTKVFYGRIHETGKTLAGKDVITPVVKKFLYIPKHKDARRYHAGLIRGVDYILTKSVKIKKRPWLQPAIGRVLKEGTNVRIGEQVYRAYFRERKLR